MDLLSRESEAPAVLLWVAFALETPQCKLFFIGERFGGFDLVALDTGQYDKRRAHIHMFPEEAAHAAEDLRARNFMPAHVGRFSIAAHDWDEPFQRVMAASQGKSYRLLTPGIGAPVNLHDTTQQLSACWMRPNR